MRHWCLVVVLALGAMGSTGAAGDTANGETVRLNAVDRAAARAATLQRTDLGPANGPPWRRVRAAPVLSVPIQCPAGDDMSMFVVTGVARARWLGGTFEVDSQADVFESPW